MGWQWHQLYHLQIICTSLHTHNHAISQFLQTGCFSWRPTNSVKTLRTKHLISHYLEKQLDDLHMANFVQPAMQQCRLVKASYLHKHHQSIQNSPQHSLRFMKVHQTHHMKVHLTHHSVLIGTRKYAKLTVTYSLDCFFFLRFTVRFFTFTSGSSLFSSFLTNSSRKPRKALIQTTVANDTSRRRSPAHTSNMLANIDIRSQYLYWVLPCIKHSMTTDTHSSNRSVVNKQTTTLLRHGDGAGNTAEENSSVFSLIRMRWLPSVLWHCWLGGRKCIWTVKKWGMMEVGTG